MKLVNGFWFPAQDFECSAAIFGETHKIDKILDLFKGRDVAVQAGGNVGVFAEYMARHFKAVYTFEPDPLNYACLARNLKSENIKPYPAGLSDTPGDCSMVGKHKNCGALQTKDGGDIPLMTIDSLHLDACDLIYLDIEGAEERALLGARETIRLYHPVIVTENKGLTPGFPSGLGGSESFRRWVCTEFGYEHCYRLMRDDVFA